MRSSGYGLMVVKTTDSAADAEQIALSGASRRLSTPKSVRHGAVGAQNRRRHPPRPPGKAAASLRTNSANIYIYLYAARADEVCGTAQSNLTHKHPVSKVGRAHKRGEEARKVLLWPWWRPQPPLPPPKATRHQPCPTERRVKAPDPQEPTRPRTFRNAVLGHATRF